MRAFRTSPLLLAIALTGAVAMPAFAQSMTHAEQSSDSTTLSLSTEAEASAAPDIASISTGVTSRANTSDAAMSDNAQRMQKLMQAIKAAGIAEKDVQTSGIMLQPQTVYEEGKAPRIEGYEARNTVSLKVRDLSKLGAVIKALADQGADQINGPSFSIDDPEPLYDQARATALKTAQERAKSYADRLGLKVRRIVSISEGRSGRVVAMPMMRMTAMKASADMAPPVSVGESSVSINLDVKFELGK